MIQQKTYEKLLTTSLLFDLPFPHSPKGTQLLRTNRRFPPRKSPFVYANDLWKALEIGGECYQNARAMRAKEKAFPHFSPDGNWIGPLLENTIGNTDVYLIPATGGEPKRLTWHFQRRFW